MLDGDSTNLGYNPIEVPQVPNQIANNPAELMQRDMDAAFGAGRVTVVDETASGSTLADDISGQNYANKGTLVQRLSEVKPDLVLTNSEINDVSYYDVNTYKANLIQWIQLVQAAGARPVLQEPNPLCPKYIEQRDDMDFVLAMDQVGNQMGVSVLSNYETWFSVESWWVTNLQPDCIHPTDEGYAAKERQYFKALKPIATAMLQQ
ncbi:hypothetical protein LMG28688_01630 [Paraburkholderia caffeinitolerans]|uniref:SGNH hydrolase-type esterase domain-containing protein n=1 Tax=Paraburkholderia caffeinitolerans TaxID=1723730 RepID=A0A6J5FQI5_9BURK|nr:SGNH/GDSL hydrolase family protein [Paraburkholderia caffeinitolerans]CAB3783354.1 hypothetical protein LMG28688_01630 [Paraburkholderia caffeinitolerans]